MTTPRRSRSTPRRPSAGVEFGNVPERAYALLGQGRCLSAIGSPEAEEPLQEARELFESMGYQPALAETESCSPARTPPPCSDEDRRVGCDDSAQT